VLGRDREEVASKAHTAFIGRAEAFREARRERRQVRLNRRASDAERGSDV
jgi:hypothetical protein